MSDWQQRQLNQSSSLEAVSDESLQTSSHSSVPGRHIPRYPRRLEALTLDLVCQQQRSVRCKAYCARPYCAVIYLVFPEVSVRIVRTYVPVFDRRIDAVLTISPSDIEAACYSFHGILDGLAEFDPPTDRLVYDNPRLYLDLGSEHTAPRLPPPAPVSPDFLIPYRPEWSDSDDASSLPPTTSRSTTPTSQPDDTSSSE